MAGVASIAAGLLFAERAALLTRAFGWATTALDMVFGAVSAYDSAVNIGREDRHAQRAGAAGPIENLLAESQRNHARFQMNYNLVTGAADFLPSGGTMAQE